MPLTKGPTHSGQASFKQVKHSFAEVASLQGHDNINNIDKSWLIDRPNTTMSDRQESFENNATAPVTLVLTKKRRLKERVHREALL